MIHENIELTGSFNISGSFVLPNHVNTASLVEETGSMYHDQVDGVLKIYTGTQWVVVGDQSGSAAADPTNLEYLLIAGGAGGAIQHGGGGGAGGYLSSSLNSVTSGSSFTVTVGGAGAGGIYSSGNASGTDGVDSSIGATGITITAAGGGGGSSYATQTVPGSGGSGGGGGNQTSGTQSGGSGTAGQGNNGGDGSTSSTNYPSGGGGGAGAVGGNASAGVGGSGGIGKRSNITGTLTYYAGGGGSATYQGGTPGTGGQGGGATGVSAGNTNGNNATTNTGGGGSGGNGGSGYYGGSGGAGVAIFAYPTGSINGAGGIIGTTSSGNKYNQFNSSGTLTLGGASDFQIVTDSLGLHIDAGNFSSRGTSTATDLSGNGNNMTVTGATLNNNFYYSISSTSTYLTCASDASIKSTTALTLEAWVRITDLTNQWKPIFSKGNTDSTEDYILLARPGNNVIYFDCGAGSLYAQPSFTWASNTWYHIVATHSRPSGTSTMGIKINNSALSTSVASPTATVGNTTDALHIGTARNNSIGGAGIEIAQARIYTKVLTASEITQNYNATKHNFV